ncbi:shikimate dehydrogenase [Rhizobiales bacterium TNE-4]|nr:shikimate dehydrogenase [Rhizobiales bacterium TNE-4]MBV1826985.1 shikimate dehydrogenase [Rhizobiales bacterium TNE-4]
MTRLVKTRDTILMGLIGAGIGASRSPALHQSEGLAQGFPTVYRLVDLDVLKLDVAALPALLQSAERTGFQGLNITFPCKQAVIQHLTKLDPAAEALGAVNTVVLKDGERIGYNTDWSGYAEAFKAQMQSASRQRVVQFGAGGAGSAVAYALLTLGVQHLTLVEADAKRAETVAQQFAPRFPQAVIQSTSDAEAAVKAADGVVNCTPVGMDKYPGTPFPTAWLKPTHWVSEIIYFPLETELLRVARALGCRTIDGSGMNVYQAAEAFRIITGLTPDPKRMRGFFDAL